MKLLPEDIDSLISRSRKANCATVIFSHPSQHDFTVLTQDLAQPVTNGSSFIFKPFTNKNVPEIIIHPTHTNEDALKYVGNFPKGERWEIMAAGNIESTSFEEYSEAFKKCQEAIIAGECSKAVLSSIVKHPMPEDFSYGEFIVKLRKEYPGAYIYILTSPLAGTWLGATPETLLKWNNGEVTTMSLAGTRSLSAGSVFGEKERIEQQIVTSYIEQFFIAAFGSYTVAPLEELHYGNLVHLISKVSAKAPASFSIEMLLDMASRLHPTPAVGGSPKEQAMDLILTTENHSRYYYSGYLGPTTSSSADLYVNLRCMTVAQNTMFIFAGGGITKDSHLQSEWHETRMKANALLKFV